MSKNNKEKDWNIQEKVVAIIEQFLDEAATIKHDKVDPIVKTKAIRV